jgi:hypothetical protein
LAAAVDATELNTLASLQTVVTQAISALAAIEAAAQSNNATATTPSLAQYDALGVTGVTTQNLASVNDALNDADITGVQANTAAKVQAIVDGFNAILTNADGTANNASNPTQTNYAAIGVSGVDTAQEVSLLGDVIDGKAPGDVDRVSKVQTLADAVQAVMNGNPSEAQLAALGITGVTSANLSSVQAALAVAVDATELNSLTGLQTVVTAAITALAAIEAAAQGNNATATTPSAAQYDALGVTGVTEDNLAAVQAALAAADVKFPRDGHRLGRAKSPTLATGSWAGIHFSVRTLALFHRSPAAPETQRHGHLPGPGRPARLWRPLQLGQTLLCQAAAQGA